MTMRGKKAKAIRMECQNRHGATKAKEYFIVREVGIIFADEPRRYYKAEKRLFITLKKKQRKHIK